MKKSMIPQISLNDDDFGLILNAAIRYSIGRRTYMPHSVIEFITPLLPYLNNRTLACIEQDIVDAGFEPPRYGDEVVDEPAWMRFLDVVREEKVARGMELYKSWREK